MAQEALIDGNKINDERPLAVETQTDSTVGIQGADGEGELATLRRDPTTNAAKIIAYAHSEVHGGNHYYIEGWVELDDTETLYVKLVTPDTTKWGHFTWEISSSGITLTTFDEEATGGMTGGTGVVPINNDRNSANVSGFVITNGVTIATGYTTRIGNAKWGAGGKFTAGGGGSSRSRELKMKQDTTYLRAFTSGTDDNIIQFAASWYEHTDIPS